MFSRFGYVAAKYGNTIIIHLETINHCLYKQLCSGDLRPLGDAIGYCMEIVKKIVFDIFYKPNFSNIF